MGEVHKTQLLGCFLQENSLLLDRTKQGLEARGLGKQEMSGMWEGPAQSGSGQWRRHAGVD